MRMRCACRVSQSQKRRVLRKSSGTGLLTLQPNHGVKFPWGQRQTTWGTNDRIARMRSFPSVQFDNAEAGQEGKIGNFEFAVGSDLSTGSIWASAILQKGREDPYSVASAVSWLAELGHWRVVLQAGGAPAEQAFIGAVRGKALRCWARRADTRLTAYEKMHQKKFSCPMVEIGEGVVCRQPGAAQNKLELPWLEGLWLGRDSRTNEHLVGTPTRVTRSRAIRPKVVTSNGSRTCSCSTRWHGRRGNRHQEREGVHTLGKEISPGRPILLGPLPSSAQDQWSGQSWHIAKRSRRTAAGSERRRRVCHPAASAGRRAINGSEWLQNRSDLPSATQGRHVSWRIHRIGALNAPQDNRVSIQTPEIEDTLSKAWLMSDEPLRKMAGSALNGIDEKVARACEGCMVPGMGRSDPGKETMDDTWVRAVSQGARRITSRTHQHCHTWRPSWTRCGSYEDTWWLSEVTAVERSTKMETQGTWRMVDLTDLRPMSHLTSVWDSPQVRRKPSQRTSRRATTNRLELWSIARIGDTWASCCSWRHIGQTFNRLLESGVRHCRHQRWETRGGWRRWRGSCGCEGGGVAPHAEREERQARGAGDGRREPLGRWRDRQEVNVGRSALHLWMRHCYVVWPSTSHACPPWPSRHGVLKNKMDAPLLPGLDVSPAAVCTGFTGAGRVGMNRRSLCCTVTAAARFTSSRSADQREWSTSLFVWWQSRSAARTSGWSLPRCTRTRTRATCLPSPWRKSSWSSWRRSWSCTADHMSSTTTGDGLEQKRRQGSLKLLRPRLARCRYRDSAKDGVLDISGTHHDWLLPVWLKNHFKKTFLPFFLPFLPCLIFSLFLLIVFFFLPFVLTIFSTQLGKRTLFVICKFFFPFLTFVYFKRIQVFNFFHFFWRDTFLPFSHFPSVLRCFFFHPYFFSEKIKNISVFHLLFFFLKKKFVRVRGFHARE